mmetsp:Transcript_6686/g.21094  ORF Transcript_6686/g.21094 Transcript_6686/m.21094 type:complete len:135 (-) Transcript_6686:37-441(-)
MRILQVEFGAVMNALEVLVRRDANVWRHGARFLADQAERGRDRILCWLGARAPEPAGEHGDPHRAARPIAATSQSITHRPPRACIAGRGAVGWRGAQGPVDAPRKRQDAQKLETRRPVRARAPAGSTSPRRRIN